MNNFEWQLTKFGIGVGIVTGLSMGIMLLRFTCL
jgi:hypothetical protein